jgi:hypothetical protein
MGIDIEGGMLIGAHGSKIIIPEEYEDEWYEFLEDHDWVSYSEHYDAGFEYSYIGYPIDDILVDEIDDKWLEKIRVLAAEFEKITGVKAYLIGTQNVW